MSRVAFMLCGVAVLAACDGNVTPDAGNDSVPSCDDDTSVGVEVGERLPNAPIQRCDESALELHDTFCGESLTLVDIGAALFEQCVAATEIYASDPAFDALQADGLNIVQVFTTDEVAQPTDAAFCERYTAQYDIDFEFLIDPLANTDSFGAVHPLAFLVDGAGVILKKWEGVNVANTPEEISAFMD